MMIATGVILCVAILFLAFKGVMSHYQQPELGLNNDTLQPCPDKPNCVCSEQGQDQQHAIAPVNVNGEPELVWARMEQAVRDSGGVIIRNDDTYMQAEFTSPVFRFVDDVEARLDREAGVIHLRSASRIGHSDFGANRKRIEAILSKLETTR